MNDDYLWDKSGEPDTEIEQLEQLLGNLRYKHPSKGLPLPLRAPLKERRTFKPFLAAAAALMFMIIAGALWLVLSGGSRKEAAGVLASGVEAVRLSDRLNLEGMSAAALQRAADETEKPEHIASVPTGSHPDRPRRAPALNRREPTAPLAARATPSTRVERISEDEGVAAREQLIRALHLTSSKLNQVQKKMQDNKGAGPVS